MTGVVTAVCLVLAFGTALVTGLLALRDRAVNRLAIVAAGLTELAVLVYVGARVTDLARGHHPPSLGIVIAYLIGIILTLPIAGALARVEVTRWGSVTLGAGALIVCVLFARINQLWTPHG